MKIWVLYVLVIIDMKYAFILFVKWSERLLKGNKALEIWVESINRMIYTIVSLLEKFCSVPFRSIPYPLWVTVLKAPCCLATGLHTIELLVRTLSINSLEIYLRHCESFNFKSRCELCSGKNHSKKLS